MRTIAARLVSRPARAVVAGTLLGIVPALAPWHAGGAESRASTAATTMSTTASTTASTTMSATATPAAYRRPAEATWLALPDWYLAADSQEYARFIAVQSPAEFPYFPAIGQFWSSFRTAAQVPDHATHRAATLLVGTGKTVEYVAKAAYETTVGRLTAATCSHGTTDEDRFAMQVAREYGDFVRGAPWYGFDYAGRLQALWRDTDWLGDDMLRKWERRLVLSLEYGIKGAAGWTARQVVRMRPQANAARDGAAATQTATGTATETAIVLDKLPAPGADLGFLKGVSRLANGNVLVLVPRQDRAAITALATAGANFAEIAGNRAEVVLSVLAPRAWQPADDKVTVMVEAPVPVAPETKRVALSTSVANLAPTLRTLDAHAVAVERVFDY